MSFYVGGVPRNAVLAVTFSPSVFMRCSKIAAEGWSAYCVSVMLPTYKPKPRKISIKRMTSVSYVMPRSLRRLFFLNVVRVDRNDNLRLIFQRQKHLDLVVRSKPGSTREAWKSSNSLPPNSRYSLPNWSMRSRIRAQTAARYTSDCQNRFSSWSFPFLNSYVSCVLK